tara:strand:+ start:245 stop:487 length:243 start_codon:yes stop_codon:yes gene_type:complete
MVQTPTPKRVNIKKPPKAPTKNIKYNKNIKTLIKSNIKSNKINELIKKIKLVDDAKVEITKYLEDIEQNIPKLPDLSTFV